MFYSKKVVIDMGTSEILERDRIPYDGPLELCGGFGQVIPIVGTPNGFLGEPSRMGGGDPLIITRQANVNNANNINFGNCVVILPDATGGTCKDYADWQANGGGLQVGGSGFNNASPIVTPGNLAGISLGMLVFNAGIPAGTYVIAINPVNGQVTLSKTPTGANNANTTLQFVVFGGIAVREVKTQFNYGLTPGAPLITPTVGSYQPGQYVGILTRGAITVQVNVGAPVAEGPAYLRAIVNGGIPAGKVGGFESNNDGNNSILLANVPSVADAFFKNGALDSNNLCELVLTSRAAA